ncbi:MAG TPA: periplasmic heavy metal sensor [bacterium]|nr:periplasmic heavy metal sensor [bacterium]HPR86394.1 periplasmic heavy metal sensor [bacterium]
MKKRWFLAALLLLTVVNLAAFSSLAWRRWCAHCSSKACCPVATAGILSQELDLSPEQTAAVESLHSRFSADARILSERLEQEQVVLTQELMKEQPDSAVISLVLRRISDRQYGLSRASVDHLLAQKKLLSPGQQQKLFGMVLHSCAMNSSQCIHPSTNQP